MNVLITVCLAVLAVAGAMCLIRLWIGPSLADRVVAAEAFLLVLLGGVGLAIIATEDEYLVAVLLVIALLGFVGTTGVARYIERRGAR